MTRRSSVDGGGAVERMATQFFNELDNLSELSQVIVLGATNREDLLDPALTCTGRLDYVLRFPIPDTEDRLQIFQVHTREKPLADDVDLRELAELTEGMVGSQVAFLCRNAAMLAITELINGKEKAQPAALRITARHFKAAIGTLQKKGEGASC